MEGEVTSPGGMWPGALTTSWLTQRRRGEPGTPWFCMVLQERNYLEESKLNPPPEGYMCLPASVFSNNSQSKSWQERKNPASIWKSSRLSPLPLNGLRLAGKCVWWISRCLFFSLPCSISINVLATKAGKYQSWKKLHLWNEVSLRSPG